MSNEIMIFRNDVFSDVRTVMIDDEPCICYENSLL